MASQAFGRFFPAAVQLRDPRLVAVLIGDHLELRAVGDRALRLGEPLDLLLHLRAHAEELTALLTLAAGFVAHRVSPCPQFQGSSTEPKSPTPSLLKLRKFWVSSVSRVSCGSTRISIPEQS